MDRRPLSRMQTRWALAEPAFTPLLWFSTRLDSLLGGWGSDGKNLLHGADDHVAWAELMELSSQRLRAIEQTALRKADVVIVVGR